MLYNSPALLSLHPQSAQGIQELLNVAKQHIPYDFWKATPLVLKATAGLRLLPGEKAQKLLQKVSLAISPRRGKGSLKKTLTLLGMMVHICRPGTRVAKRTVSNQRPV